MFNRQQNTPLREDHLLLVSTSSTCQNLTLNADCPEQAVMSNHLQKILSAKTDTMKKEQEGSPPIQSS
jgi:hypothetical protein